MDKKRLRMFAGPNGSGKSELIKELEEREIPLGPLVNADNIAKKLKETGFIDLSDYKRSGVAILELPELSSQAVQKDCHGLCSLRSLQPQ